MTRGQCDSLLLSLYGYLNPLPSTGFDRRTTSSVSAAAPEGPRKQATGCQSSGGSTMDARAASHDRSRPDTPAIQGRRLQTRVGRADITFLVGSESQTNLSGTASIQNHPAISRQRQLPVGSLGLGSCQAAHLVLSIAAAPPVAGLATPQLRGCNGLGRCKHQQSTLPGATEQRR
jgi:hypothetical protein